MLTHPQSEPVNAEVQLRPERNRHAGGIVLILVLIGLGIFILLRRR